MCEKCNIDSTCEETANYIGRYGRPVGIDWVNALSNYRNIGRRRRHRRCLKHYFEAGTVHKLPNT
jgi:hypothetical protein